MAETECEEDIVCLFPNELKISVHLGEVSVDILQEACSSDDVWISAPISALFDYLEGSYRGWFSEGLDQRMPDLGPVIAEFEKGIARLRRIQADFPGRFHEFGK